MIMTKYATFWDRLLAHNIDLLFILIPLFVLEQWIVSNRILYLTAFGLYLLYHIVFEVSKWQASPGKRALRIKVVNEDGSKPGVFRCLARNLLKLISLIPLFGGFIMIVFTSNKQGLHDRLSGSIQVKEMTDF